MKTFFCVFILITLNNFSYSQQAFWEQMNGPYAGNIYDICINQQNVIFTEGVYRSINSGDNWDLCNNGIGAGGPNRFAVNSLNHVWGTNNEKLFYSTNDGEMWYELSAPMHNSISINSNDYIFLGEENRVFISTDNGTSWNTYELPNSGPIVKFAFNSLDYIYAAAEYGVYRSTDNGLSWIEVLNGSTFLTVYVDNNDIIFVGNYYNIYKSTNNGDDWITITNNIIGGAFYAIAANSLNELFVGMGHGIYKSTDLGENWVQKNDGIRHLSIRSISVEGNDNIFIGTEWGGIYKTTNAGEDWLQTGVPANSISSLVILSNDVLFAEGGLSGSEIFRTTNDGLNWDCKMNGLTGSIGSIARNPFGEIVAATHDTIYSSSDYGETWLVKGAGDLPGYLPFEISPSDQIFVGAMGGGFFRSTDYGNTWIHCLSNCYANCIAFDSSGNIYAGTSLGIRISTDEGNNWTPNLLEGQNIESIVIGLQDNIYASSVSSNRNFYKSTDYGVSWLIMSSGIYFHSLKINKEGILFGGKSLSKDGVFSSTDDGVTWEEINDGLYFEHRDINELAINSQGFLFAATSLGSVYKSVETVNDVIIDESLIIDFHLYQNYPNPFNPSTKIRYSVPQTSIVVIKVFDVLGNEIETLVNEEKPAGTYELNWYAEGLTSGIYFYQLQTENFVETKKMLLIK